MALQTTPQHSSSERRHHHNHSHRNQHQQQQQHLQQQQQQQQRQFPPAVPPHKNINFNFDTEWVTCQPDMLYPQLQNFAYATSTIDHGALVRQRRQHRQKSSTEDILNQFQPQQQQQQQQQQPQQQRSSHSHHHHHHHHHHEGGSTHRPRYKTRHVTHVTSSASHQKRQEFKSAPSSPVSHHRSRLDHSSQLLLLQESEKPQTCVTGVTVTHCIDQASDKSSKLSTTKSKSRKKTSYFADGSKSPAHVPILSATDDATSTTPTKLSAGSRRVTTGCCVAMGVNKMAKHRRPLSGSYSALVRKIMAWPLSEYCFFSAHYY